jgi:hypothetical protein
MIGPKTISGLWLPGRGGVQAARVEVMAAGRKAEVDLNGSPNYQEPGLVFARIARTVRIGT